MHGAELGVARRHVERSGERQREPALARAAHADERQQPRGRQNGLQLLQLAFASDESRQLGWQVALHVVDVELEHAGSTLHRRCHVPARPSRGRLTYYVRRRRIVRSDGPLL